MKIKRIPIFILIMMTLSFSYVQAEPTTRIVGGNEAEEDAYPFMAALVYKGSKPFNGQFCGGTLIQSEWVVTAAHCVTDNRGYPESEDSMDVILGIHNLKSDISYNRYSVSKIIVNPSYNDFTVDSDIALLKLSQPADSKYTPISLVSEGSDYVGQMATVMGWGALVEDGSFPDDYPDALMEISIPVVSNETCSESIWGITNNMICAGYQKGELDACSGDSGGPLVIYENGEWKLLGIVSFGEGCARPDYYGVYTRVANFNSFVEDYIGTRTTEADYQKGYDAAVEVCKANPAACGIDVYSYVASGPLPDGRWVVIFPDPQTVTDDNFWDKIDESINTYNQWNNARN